MTPVQKLDPTRSSAHLTPYRGFAIIQRLICTRGEMSEWFMEPVLKTGDAARHRGFESLSLRHISRRGKNRIRRSTQVAIRGSPAKGVGWVNRRQGSNPCFSAKQRASIKDVLLFVRNLMGFKPRPSGYEEKSLRRADIGGRLWRIIWAAQP